MDNKVPLFKPFKNTKEEQVQGYVSEGVICAAAVAGGILAFGAMLFPPAGMGAALVFYAVSATLSPAIITVSFVTACF